MSITRSSGSFRLLTYFIAGFFLLQQGSVFASQVSSADLLNQLDQSTPFFSTEQRLAAQQALEQKLQQAGVASEELSQRIAALSDQDLQELQTRFDQQTAGGDIVGAVVFVFIVLLITDIVGLTDVFPFVHHHHHRSHPRGKTRYYQQNFNPELAPQTP